MADTPPRPPVVPDGPDEYKPLVPAVFKLLQERNEDLFRILKAYDPLRIEQERFFRPRGPDCKWYHALCHKIAMEACGGQLPGALEILKAHVA